MKQTKNVIEARHTPEVSHAEDRQNANDFTKVIKGAPAEIRTQNVSIPSTSSSYQILAEESVEQGNIVQNLRAPLFPNE